MGIWTHAAYWGACSREKGVREAKWGSKDVGLAGVQPQPGPRGALERELHPRVGHTLRQGIDQKFIPHFVGI